jgi:hypothetical protein
LGDAETPDAMFQLPVPICVNLRSSAVGLCFAPIRVHSRAFAVAIVLLIANAMVGCAGHSTQRTEDLLSAAGFNVVIASTPQRLQHLATLPPYKVIRIQRNGKDRYVYADPAQKLIYVGGVFAYQRFKDLRLTKNLAEQDIQDAEFNAQRAAEWDVWGPF